MKSRLVRRLQEFRALQHLKAAGGEGFERYAAQSASSEQCAEQVPPPPFRRSEPARHDGVSTAAKAARPVSCFHSWLGCVSRRRENRIKHHHHKEMIASARPALTTRETKSSREIARRIIKNNRAGNARRMRKMEIKRANQRLAAKICGQCPAQILI